MVHFKFINVVFFFLLPITLWAAQIHGTILDRKTHHPLPGANIYIENTTIGVSSDLQGSFSLTIPDSLSGTYTVFCSYVGYHDESRIIRLPLLQNLTLSFQLKESLLLMDQIVVTGTRSERFLKDTPVTTQVIKGEALTERGSTNLAEVLSEATGITTEYNPRFGSGIDLQGFDSNHILLLINGVKAIGRLNGEMDFSQFQAANIERIEVVKGATSAQYGSQAMGGVINIITKEPFDSSGLNASLRYGSYNRIDAGSAVHFMLGNWQPQLRFNYRHSDGFDLDKSDQKTDGPHYNKYDADFSVTHKGPSSTHTQLRTRFFIENKGQILNNFFESRTANSRQTIYLQDTRPAGTLFNLHSSVSYSFYKHTYEELVRSSGFVKASDPTENELFKANFQASKTIFNNDVQLGYNFEKESIQSQRISGNIRRSDLHSLYILDEWKPFASTTLLSGIRMDSHSIYGNHISPKISLMWAATHTSRIRLAYGQGFRAPSFKELYLTLHVDDVNLTITGNPDLKPETSESVNLDYEIWNSDNYHTRLNLFFNRITNLINDIRIPADDGSLRYTYHNFSQAKTWGVEWDMKYFPTDFFEFTLGYRYLNSVELPEHTPIPGKIMHKGHGSILLKFPYSMRLNTRVQFFGSRNDSYIDESSNTVVQVPSIPAYWLSHANLSKTFSNGLIFTIGGRNLSNYINIQWGPVPGREWYTGLSFNL